MSSVKIANGASNTGGLKTLETLSGSLFALYKPSEALTTTWHEYEGRETDGNRYEVAYGLPWVEWTFFQLTRTEVAYLKATFGNLVTIRTLDKGDNTYKNFNATYVFPQLSDKAKYDAGFWYDVVVTFRDLQVI